MVMTWLGCAVGQLRYTKAIIRYAIRMIRVTAAVVHPATVDLVKNIANVLRAKITETILKKF